MNSHDIKIIENTIQYEFNNKALLSQAFLFNAENDDDIRTNEILREIGKRAIDYSLVDIIVSYYGNLCKGKPFRMNNGITATHDILNNLQSKDLYRISVNVLGLTQYIESITAGEIDDADRKLFESIIGAVTLDTNWDHKRVSQLVSFMIDIDYWLDHGFDSLDKNPTTKVYNYSVEANINQPLYSYKKVKDEFGNEFINCQLKLDISEKAFEGTGNSASEARFIAASNCYNYLEENKLIQDIVKDAGEFNIDNAMDVLDNLALKGYFTLADYDTKEAKDGFTATVMIDEVDSRFEGTDADKHKARSKAAYKMVCYVLGYQVPSDEDLNK